MIRKLHRHAARYPTYWGGRCIRRVMGKLANRTVTVPRRHPELAFLKNADLTMEDWRFEELLNQGRKA